MVLPSLCGCFHLTPLNHFGEARFLPQVDLKVHSTILASTSRTTLTQTFINPSLEVLKNVKYTLPLYEGVSVVAFKCEVGDRCIHGLVKPREEAKAEYDKAVEQGKAAALLEQARYTSEVFTTGIGNVPQTSKVVVEITYLGTLQHDAEADGLRFTIPVSIAPRYTGRRDVTEYEIPSNLDDNLAPIVKNGKISITADVAVDKNSTIREIQSPSHPISVSLGRQSTSTNDDFKKNCASAALTMKAGHVFFNNDFVLIVQATEQDVPVAYLETHPNIPSQRAIMATLVPKFNLPNISPEIVFLIDRSASMSNKIGTLRSALRVFLKSLPVGIVFNICSFGSSCSFLWGKSQVYNDSSLETALKFVEEIAADMGGTEIYAPTKAAVSNRFKDKDLEVLLLTDGQITDQKRLFEYIEETASDNPIRFFSLGIGEAASHSLINGVARAGRGFAQTVGTNEQFEKKVVRMLKGALSPHIDDYRAELEFGADEDEGGYDMVENAEDIPIATDPPPAYQDTEEKVGLDSKKDKPETKPPISLYDPSFKESGIEETKPEKDPELINLPVPKVLQAPHKLPQLYPFNRTNVYFLLSPGTCQKTPRYIVLSGTSRHGPLTLRIPIEDIGQGISTHQLAARALSHELEEGRGWIFHAKDMEGKTIVERHESKKEHFVKREAIRLGMQFQVSGKYCSFVAVESDKQPGGSESAGAAEQGPLFVPQTEFSGSSDMGIPHLLQNPESNLFCLDLLSSDFDPTIEATDWDTNRRAMTLEPRLKDGASPREREHFKLISTDSPDDKLILHSKSQKHGSLALSKGFEKAGRKVTAKFQSVASDVFKGKKKTRASGSGESTSVPAKSATDSKEELSNSKGTTSSKEATSTKTPTNPKNVHAIIALQTFEGSWRWEDGVFETANFDEKDLETKLDWPSILGVKGQVNDPDQRAVIVTLATVAYLHKEYASEIETWELVADKAMTWVRTKLDETGGDSSRDNKEFLALFEKLF